MGPITGQWLSEKTKRQILLVIATSHEQGVSARRTCTLLVIAYQRILRWQKRDRQGLDLADASPGPAAGLHRLLPEEVEQIAAMAKRQEYADLSHRILAVTAWEQGLFFASFSSVYRVLKERNLMTARGGGGSHNGRSLAPVRKELTGPNQRWCWDISYLLTFEKGIYLYLYVLLDEFSRKAIQWRISWVQTAEQARLLLESGLGQENILDLPEDQRPEVINDRGRQMKAKPIKNLFEEHGMPQLFARPRTPNDNPFIESMFSTVKRAPEYPGQFLDDAAAGLYFDRYFAWYNNEHYHSAIDYVTPQEAHQGLRSEIVRQRLTKQHAQRLLRRRKNLQRKSTPQKPKTTINQPASLVA